MTPGERAYITQAYNALVAAGWTPVGVDDGDSEDLVPTKSLEQMLEAIDSVDASWAFFQNVYGHKRDMMLVLGNDPSGVEVIADYHTSSKDNFGLTLASLGELK
jgi:hypothetical protein